MAIKWKLLYQMLLNLVIVDQAGHHTKFQWFTAGGMQNGFSDWTVLVFPYIISLHWITVIELKYFYSVLQTIFFEKINKSVIVNWLLSYVKIPSSLEFLLIGQTLRNI